MSGGVATSVSQGHVVRVVGNICKLVSTMLVCTSCESSNFCSAHTLLGPLQQTMPCILSVRLWRKLGHGDALHTSMWGKGVQCTCEVQHVPTVLEWAVDSYSGMLVLAQEQRAELVSAVHKTACDLAVTRHTHVRDAMTGSIGVDVDVADGEVCLLHTDVQRVKAREEDAITQLQHMHTELICILEEASRGSTSLAAAHSELEEEVLLRPQLQQHFNHLKTECQVTQEGLAHMHTPGQMLLGEEDASLNETRDQVIPLIFFYIYEVIT